MSRKQFSLGLVAAAVLGAAACGGGGDGGAPAQKPTEVVGSASGVLYGAAGVEGVAYSTSSGIKSVTGAGGSYRFNANDTVTFTLGGLALGTVSATSMVTPLELAAGNATKLNNLIVLLQSLDQDGAPGNGIAIPAAAAAAVPATVKLEQPFTEADRSAIVAAMKAGGITAPMKTQSEADAAFVAGAMTVLSAGESAVWAWFDNDAALILRIRKDGEYLYGDADRDETNNNILAYTAGVEAGKIVATKFDHKGFQLSPTFIRVDTNLQAGFSHLYPDERFRSDGESLFYADDESDTPFGVKKIVNDPAGIRGAWALGSASDVDVLSVFFFENNRFLLVDPFGDTSASRCGGPGVEFGSFAWDSGSKSLSISNLSYDTNGCAGLNDPKALNRPAMNFTLAADGKTAILSVAGKAPLTLYRVSR